MWLGSQEPHSAAAGRADADLEVQWLKLVLA